VHTFGGEIPRVPSTVIKNTCITVFWLVSLQFQLFMASVEWFGLEGTLKIIWFQPPCHEQGHLPLDRAAQSSIQPGLGHCQGGGSHSFSGQPVPVFHHPHGEEFLPDIQSKSALFQFTAVPPCPVTTHPFEKSLSILPVGPCDLLGLSR